MAGGRQESEEWLRIQPNEIAEWNIYYARLNKPETQ